MKSATHNSLRDGRVDSIRGLLLIMMTLDHFGGLFSRLTDQPLGFVSALPGFIMMSGFLYGRIYGQIANRDEHLWMKSLSRAWLIYRYHLALLVFIFLLIVLSPLHAVPLDEMVRPFSLHGNAVFYALMSLLLLHEPVLMDILPVYALLVLISPLAVLAFRRGAGWLVVVASLGLWWLSLHVGNPVTWLSDELCGDCRYGYINILSWQLVWVIGLAIGFPGNGAAWLRFARRPAILLLSLGIAVGLFLLRHGWIAGTYDAYHGVNKLSELRVLNLVALLVPLTVLISRLPKRWEIPWVGLLGRYSLQVFAFHVAMAYLLLPFEAMIIAREGDMAYAAFTLVVVALLFVPVFWQRYRDSELRQRAR